MQKLTVGIEQLPCQEKFLRLLNYILITKGTTGLGLFLIIDRCFFCCFGKINFREKNNIPAIKRGFCRSLVCLYATSARE